MKPKLIRRFHANFLKIRHEFTKGKENAPVKRTTKISVPDMPRAKWHSNGEPDFSQFSDQPAHHDPVEAVKTHLIGKLGHQAAMKRLKVMSGMEVVTLADKLKTEATENTTKIARKEGQYEEYSMPTMKF